MPVNIVVDVTVRSLWNFILIVRFVPFLLLSFFFLKYICKILMHLDMTLTLLSVLVRLLI